LALEACGRHARSEESSPEAVTFLKSASTLGARRDRKSTIVLHCAFQSLNIQDISCWRTKSQTIALSFIDRQTPD
jgi:hypothetical protein